MEDWQAFFFLGSYAALCVCEDRALHALKKKATVWRSGESPNNRVHESYYDSIMKKTQNARGNYLDKQIDCMLKKAFCLFAWYIRYF